jgi:phosphoglycerate kinase
MAKLTIDQLDVGGKRVLVRVDFNVPQDEQGNITDDTRIRASLPTINYILEHGGSAILMSHLGRPKSGPDPKLTLALVAKRFSQLLNREVLMLPDCIGPVVEKACHAALPGMVIMLENLRFHPEEESGDPAFAKQLAALGDLYVNDAFGTAHRAHASTAVIAQFCPQAAAGFLMAKEIDFLSRVVSHPERPYAVVLGGAKVSSKLKVIENLLPKADKIIIGGGMAYTFLAAQGHGMGKSLVEADLIPTAKSILEKDTTGKIVLRVDHICADSFDANATPVPVQSVDIPPDLMGMDIGPATIELFSRHLSDARMVFWNGPMGVFEFPAFAAGTRAIGEVIAKAPTSIVGGGDTISAVNRLGLADRYTHVSTGGGASLEFVEGLELPGIKALTDV